MIWAWIVKNAFSLICGIAILLAGIYLFQTLILGPINAKHDAAATHGTQAITAGGVKSAADAVKTVTANDANTRIIDERTRTNYVYITKQPGAADPVNPALFDALTRSVCLRVSAASLPECHGLQQPSP